jgi:hypothetical protein
MPKLMHRLLFAGAALSIFCATPLLAADKAEVGGNCCSDLEERIAELEATAAKKGNRKVSLRIYGQVNKAITHLSVDDESDTWVQENSASESFVGFSGEARINKDLKAGFVLEMGVGGYENGVSLGSDTNGVYTRRSFVYLESAVVGKLSVGHLSTATDDITNLTTANTGVAVRPLSLRPLVGPQFGEALDIFDGARADGVRWDSPTWKGFVVSASWTNADLIDNSDSYEVAVRYADAFGDFKVAGGVGYKQGFVVPTLGAIHELKTYSGSASVMHVPTGVFVTGIAGQIEGTGVLSGLPNITGWQGQAGLEENWLKVGKSTIFGEYGQLKIDGVDAEPTLIGVGFVQAVDAAALDLYVSGRQYDLDMGGDKVHVVIGGARVRF